MKNTILFFFALVLFSCSKDDNNVTLQKLPDETQTGENTFGFTVNENIYLPRDSNSQSSEIVKALSKLEGYLGNQDCLELTSLDLKSEKTSKIIVHIQDFRQNGVGAYTVDISNGQANVYGYVHNYIHCKIFDSKTNAYKFYHSFMNSGKINLTRLDAQNNIVSGNFSCKAVNSDNRKDTIEIKNGRFDINLITILNEKFP